MKFKLFGGLDCPDWILCEIAVLARLDTASLEALGAQCVKRLCADPVDWKSVDAVCEQQGLPPGDMRQAMTCLHTLLHNMVRFDVGDDVAHTELTMIGIRSEDAAALLSIVKDNKKYMLHVATMSVVRSPHVVAASTEYKVRDLGGGQLAVQLRFTTSDKTTVLLETNQQKFSALYAEMTLALQKMEK